ncbi:MAG: GNAT family N-acetyltransferase [Luteimonas sp.]
MTDPAPVALTLSRPDSDRFGLLVFRANAADIDSRTLFEAIVGNAADIVILRVPAGTHPELQQLGRYALHPIHADTLVYYQLPLADIEPNAPRNQDLEFSEVNEGDAIELDALVTAAFSGYVSHYHANPRLDPARILEGYAQWASGYLADKGRGSIAWVARRQGVMLAFICCRHDPQQETCEVVLNGVHPDHWRGGIYTDLLRYTQGEYRRRGYRSMRISTQIWNYAVQKVWNREGFSLDQAFDTFHINAMLSAGEMLVERGLVLGIEGVARLGSDTADAKAFAREDAAAHRAATVPLVAQGVLANGELSRILATEIARLGAELVSADVALLEPIQPGRTHTLQIRGLFRADSSGCIPTVITIRDSAGSLCLLCYSDLMKKH